MWDGVAACQRSEIRRHRHWSKARGSSVDWFDGTQGVSEWVGGTGAPARWEVDCCSDRCTLSSVSLRFKPRVQVPWFNTGCFLAFLKNFTVKFALFYIVTNHNSFKQVELIHIPDKSVFYSGWWAWCSLHSYWCEMKVLIPELEVRVKPGNCLFAGLLHNLHTIQCLLLADIDECCVSPVNKLLSWACHEKKRSTRDHTKATTQVHNNSR